MAYRSVVCLHDLIVEVLMVELKHGRVLGVHASLCTRHGGKHRRKSCEERWLMHLDLRRRRCPEGERDKRPVVRRGKLRPRWKFNEAGLDPGFTVGKRPGDPGLPEYSTGSSALIDGRFLLEPLWLLTGVAL